MAKRERLEDLGRIAEITSKWTEMPIFNKYSGRQKDFPDWWEQQNLETQQEFLRLLPYEISDLSEFIGEIWNISRWGDDEP